MIFLLYDVLTEHKEENKMTLGQRIMQIRTENALSQEKFGEMLGTTRQTVSRWELDQAYPEISKIVLMSNLFSVSVDSIIKDGISTFDDGNIPYTCGVYRSKTSAIVETVKYALVYYKREKNVIGAKLYVGSPVKKELFAVCERDLSENKTKYAYKYGDETISNDTDIAAELGEEYDKIEKNKMRRLEKFRIDTSGKLPPAVSEAGIKNCLILWRSQDRFEVTGQKLFFYLCTSKTEYVFSIDKRDENIYCAASYNTIFDLGMYSVGQFFRIRNYKDNSEKFCSFYADFSYEPKSSDVPTDKLNLRDCGYQNAVWYVKRYTDDEIVLDGCGGDEYVFKRKEDSEERFIE